MRHTPPPRRGRFLKPEARTAVKVFFFAVAFMALGGLLVGLLT